jgi:hypothetical protein
VSIDWGIPELRCDRLSEMIPARVYAGGPITDPTSTLFVWRTAALEKARGCVLAFYVWDNKLEQLWRRPQHYTALFLHHGVAAVVEPDFSVWADDAVAVQLFNVYRTRWLGRYWQDAGLNVIPSLNWSTERSYPFCFAGIPTSAPMVAVECRTPGSNDDDRRAFLHGLTEGVQQVKPRHVLIFGGMEHSYWLSSRLPPGPQYTLLPSWTHERDQIRKQEKRTLREGNQLRLFVKGVQVCTDVEPALAL